MPPKASNVASVDSSKRRKAGSRVQTNFPEPETTATQHGKETPEGKEVEHEIFPAEGSNTRQVRPEWELPLASPSPPTYHLNVASNVPSGSSLSYNQQQQFQDYYSSKTSSPAPTQADLAYRRYSNSLSTSPGYQQQRVPASPYLGGLAPNPRFPIHPPSYSSRSANAPSRASFDFHDGWKPFFHSFDSLGSSGDPASSTTDNVVLTGHDGRLDIHAIGRRVLRLIGRLVNLNGAVLSAKIIPSTSLKELFPDHRPLVSLVLYGLSVDTRSDDLGPDITGNRYSGLSEAPFAQLQTRVEVWSLRTGQLVATLYKSPLVSASYQQWPHANVRPAPPHHLRLEVQGNFIAVGSGQSGEVFIFTPSPGHTTSEKPFLCIAKFWTSIVKSFPNSRPSSSSNNDSTDLTPEAQEKQSPVFSLSHRWLAIAAPSSQSRYSISGTVPISPDGIVPVGVESVTPSAPPSANCTLDVPNPESLTNKVARGVAKEVLKGAQWVGAQGKQAWQNYWNPSPSPSSTLSGSGPEQTSAAQFPPTHAEAQGINAEVEDKGELVSIIDLQQLLRTGSASNRKRAEPIATFSLTQGCSFMSFSPHGLLLLTASHNGDTQHVWNLSKLKARKESGTALQPSISQVSTFSRFSDTRVIDIVWSKPKCDQLAIVTVRGTVHLFRLPTSAFSWPLQRPVPTGQDRRGSTQDQLPISKTEAESGDTQLPMSQAGPLSTAASSLSSRARPIVSTVRQRSSSSVSTITSNLANFNMSTAAGIQGGKYLVHGVSKSFGAAAGHIDRMRRASASKLPMKGGAESAHQDCVRFLTGRDRGLIGTLSMEHLTVHSVNIRGTSSSPSTKAIEIPLPNTSSSNPAQQNSSFWLPSQQNSETEPTQRTSSQSTELGNTLHPLACAEIETCASFQPFYVDRNITLSTFEMLNHDQHHIYDTSPWVFGDHIQTEPLSFTAKAFPQSEYIGAESVSPVRSKDTAPSAAHPVPRKSDVADGKKGADADFVTEDELHMMLEQQHQLMETMKNETDDDLMLDLEDDHDILDSEEPYLNK